MKNKIIAFFITLFMRILNKTLRYNWIGQDTHDQAQTYHPQGSLIYVLWHENIFLSLMSKSKAQAKRVYPLASISQDGQLAADVCQMLGYGIHRGSSSKGGKKALAKMIQSLKEGKHVAITLDGPKGPRHTPKRGVLDMAKKGQAMILPITAIAQKHWSLNSWDRLKIPWPFSRVIISWGRPISIPLDTSSDQYDAILLDLKNSLFENFDKAQAFFGPRP